MAVADRATIGPLLREWRERRKLSQFELALRSAVSARHLSFIETGRARPSREMVLHLGERLDVPLRERNRLLLAAGYAPIYGQRALDDEEMAPVREALERLLAAQEPYPAIVLDRGRNLVLTNRSVSILTAGVAPHLLRPPANALRIALSPEGLAPRTVNFREWSAHLLARLRREIAVSGDDELRALYEELCSYPDVEAADLVHDAPDGRDVVLPLRLRTLDGAGELSFFSTIAVFGTALDVTLEELAIEAFYPADRPTADALAAYGS